MCLPELSATKIATWNFRVYESAEGRYNMIPGRNLRTSLVLDIKFYDNVIIGGDRTFEGCLSIMFDVEKCGFTSLTDKIVKPEGSFIDSYVDKCLESDGAISSMLIMCRILYAK